jgi:hypothetical protein
VVGTLTGHGIDLSIQVLMTLFGLSLQGEIFFHGVAKLCLWHAHHPLTSALIVSHQGVNVYSLMASIGMGS